MTPREVLEKYYRNQIRIETALADLSEIVMGEKINTGNPARDSEHNSVVTDIAKLFTDKEEK